MSKPEQADHIWKHLFLERTPISEACRGILTTIQRLGLDPGDGLPRLRKFFAEQDPDHYVDKVMELSRIESITMTNAVFDDNERQRWLDGGTAMHDPRFPSRPADRPDRPRLAHRRSKACEVGLHDRRRRPR